jgi:hypothetical protein
LVVLQIFGKREEYRRTYNSHHIENCTNNYPGFKLNSCML